MSAARPGAPRAGFSTWLLCGISAVLSLIVSCQELDVTAVEVMRVEVTPELASVTVGETRQLVATLTDAAGHELRGRRVTWSSGNVAVATVDETGGVRGVGAGTTKVTATAEGRSGEATVTVLELPVAAVEVTPSSATLTRGESVQLVATPKATDGSSLTARAASWTSADAGIATVDGNGQVTATGSGATQVTATIEGVSGQASITVSPDPVATVEVLPPAATVGVGETVQLQVVVKAADGLVLEGRVVDWSSADTNIATVDADGLVTGVGEGSTTLTATSEGRSGQATVTVTPPAVASIELAPPAATLAVGDTVRFQATARAADGSTLPGQTFAWSSSDAAIASISVDGLVTGHALGAATISAAAGGTTGSAAVTVANRPVATIQLQPNTASLFVGDTLTIRAVMRSADGTLLTSRPVAWTSSDEAVATVTGALEDGKVTAVAAGSATVTAVAEGQTATAQLTVAPKPVANLDVTPASVNLAVDQTVQLQVVLTAADGSTLTGRTVTWATSASAIATVNTSGLVRGVAAGTAMITATAEGKSGTATVNVAPKPVETVTVQPALDSIRIGQTRQLTAQLRAADGTVLTGRPITWSSSAAPVATVNGSGTVTAVAVGSATITATSEGKSGQATIVVVRAPVATVAIEPNAVTLIPGGPSQQVQAIVRAADGSVLADRQVTWTATTNPAGLRITPSGSFGQTASLSANAANCAGSACTHTLTATAEGVSGTATVTVIKPISTIDIAPQSLTLAPGSTGQLQATVRAADGTVLTDRALSWSSTATAIATVQGSGTIQLSATVSAVAAACSGPSCSVTINASAEGVTGSAMVTVPKPVSAVTITPSSATLSENGTVALKASVTAADGTVLTDRQVTWSSSSTSVASVTGAGSPQLDATVQAGTCPTGSPSCNATITATAGGVNGTAAITVRKAVAQVAVQPDPVTVVEGGTRALTAVVRAADGTTLTDRQVSWSTADPAVASVTGGGGVHLNATLTGLKIGNTTVRASAGGVEGTAAVTVREAVASVSITPATVNLVEGATAPLQAVVRGTTGNVLTDRAVTWSSSSAPIASVAGSGPLQHDATLTAGSCPVGAPTCAATITATADGVSGTAGVTVAKQVATVTVTPASLSLLPGQTSQLNAVLAANDGTDLTGTIGVLWSSDDVGAATVTQTGLVTAVGAPCPAGQTACRARITVAAGNVTGHADVDVQKPVNSLDFGTSLFTVQVGTGITVAVTLLAADGTQLSGADHTVNWAWSPAAPAGAISLSSTTGESIRVNGVTVGDVTLTATAEGKSASVTIRIIP